MSNTDSFIDEVTEEVQRDRMMALLRRYGWIAALAIVAIVGGTAYNEYSKSSTEEAAKARGAAIAQALELPEPAARADALAELADGSDPVAAFFAAAQYEEAGNTAAAVSALEGLAERPDMPQLYRDLALIKRLAIDTDLDAGTRGLMLDALAQPGGAYRAIALELQALAEIEAGAPDAALAQLQTLIQDAEATNPQRQRIAQLIVALGGTPELATNGFDANSLPEQ